MSLLTYLINDLKNHTFLSLIIVLSVFIGIISYTKKLPITAFFVIGISIILYLIGYMPLGIMFAVTLLSLFMIVRVR